ncbi:hypothetical protein EXE46_04840 [Halorubrum sp. GN11_10-6_MGM]|uniref:hypothetical protein n=1 Tax=Halorubrum sp. GN11_10-6_MGM TaxID=2518112 RepID=UPI0010FA434C|nr:hypothetical protein [Halorubrum sp. GN11_10-6_MGM]TKX75195.1 hypothetical protein EXE46_04840 [Halorubrum sp. GN11_10-6_MGM]
MYVPEDPPPDCPACGDPYDSVSRHTGGFVVNLLDNERYQRVCFYPATDGGKEGADGGEPAFDCYHHTHAQAGTD